VMNFATRKDPFMQMNKVLSFLSIVGLAIAGLSSPGRAIAQSAQVPGNAFSSATAGPPAQSAVATAQLVRRDAPYRLRQGDVVELYFQLCPEFNQDVTVQPDGQISLRGTAPIKVVGESLLETQDSVVHAYTSIMREPVVAVSLKDFEKPYFIAAGQIVKPGKYDLRSSMTITEAVAIAGGFNKDAKHSEVVLFRPVGDERFESRVIDVKKLLAQRDLNEDVHLQPGDVLYVPSSKMSIIRPYLPNSNIFFNPFSY
jgi:polysaccharide export outer membrane protein